MLCSNQEHCFLSYCRIHPLVLVLLLFYFPPFFPLISISFLINSCREPEEGQDIPINPNSDEPDPFWGRDLIRRGGVLDAIYFQLRLPPFKWPGLKALPSIAPTSDSSVFRGTVRSLIAVLDEELAAGLPAPAPHRRRRGELAASSPRASHLTVPDELWEGILNSSDDEENEDEELEKDVQWERQLEEQQRQREHWQKLKLRHAGGGSGIRVDDEDDAWDMDSPLAREAKQTLRELQEMSSSASPRRGGGGDGSGTAAEGPSSSSAAVGFQHHQRSADYTKLVKQLEELTAEDALLGGDDGASERDLLLQQSRVGPSTSTETAAAAATRKEEGDLLSSSSPSPSSSSAPPTAAATTTAAGDTPSASEHSKAKKLSRKSAKTGGKPPAAPRQVSPIALAALWELLQCCIGASVAAVEAAKAAVDAETEDRRGMMSPSSPKVLQRQGPPPIVRWYDARARVALGLVSMWLQVPPRKLATLEVLLGSDKAPVTVLQRSTGEGKEKSSAGVDRYRYLKVGLAAFGGGALFAVTGGLAAPAIAAGVGSILGVVPGAGAAAGMISGFMATQVGVAAVTTTMGGAGAATIGSKMAYRTAEVKDFGFLELKETMAPAALSRSSPNKQYSSKDGSTKMISASSSSFLSPSSSSPPRQQQQSEQQQQPRRNTITTSDELSSTPTTTTTTSGSTSRDADPGHLTMSQHRSTPASGNTTTTSSRNHRSASTSSLADFPSTSNQPPPPSSSSSSSARRRITNDGSTTTKSNTSSGGGGEALTWKSWFGSSGTTSSSSKELSTAAEQDEEDDDEKQEEEIVLLPAPIRIADPAEGIKLSSIIGISGWITDPEDFTDPWTSIASPSADRFALVWCTSELQALSSALGALLAKGAAGQAARLSLQHLLVGGAGLVTALGPTVILGAAAGLLIENAWAVAIDRSDKAGKLLAHVLMAGGTAGRPVTLLAHSMGARLVFSALLELCRCGARGLVQDVVLLGAPVPPTPERWRMARRVVAGRLVNGYSRADWLLSVMFWQGIAKPVAGLAPVEVDGVENVSLGSIVGGHFDYIKSLDEILELLQVPLG